MQSLFRYVAEPHPCAYLPDREQRMEYEHVASLSPAEYLSRMHAGWRRFGTVLFRPVCATCQECQPLRVDAAAFRPNRSQRRVRQLNQDVVRLQIGKPSVTAAKLALYDRFHAYQTERKGWPEHPAGDARSYSLSFVEQPFAVEEWCYYLGNQLVGVGYVDRLPGGGGGRRAKSSPTSDDALHGGLSAIYFFHDPAERGRSLGTWNVLCLLDDARRTGLPHVYLGYFVAGCGSMAYKRRFAPNEVRQTDGTWR